MFLVWKNSQTEYRSCRWRVALGPSELCVLRIWRDAKVERRWQR